MVTGVSGVTLANARRTVVTAKEFEEGLATVPNPRMVARSALAQTSIMNCATKGSVQVCNLTV